MTERKSYQHFILTRFNLKLRYNRGDKPMEQTKEWLDQRFLLFEKYCFPSIQNQVNQNFTWLCMFDVDTPVVFKKKIETYSQYYPNFVPLFLSEEEAAQDRKILIEEIKKRSEEATHILTTRIDNDDSLHADMVDSLQKHLRFDNKKVVYSFVSGYQYFERMNFLFRMYYPNNHFLSMIEPNDENLISIMAYRHSRARKNEEHLDIKTDKPYWVEVVHGGNVNNQFMFSPKYRYLPVFQNKWLKEYGLDIQLKRSDSIKSFILNVLPYVFRQAMTLVLNKIKHS